MRMISSSAWALLRCFFAGAGFGGVMRRVTECGCARGRCARVGSPGSDRARLRERGGAAASAAAGAASSSSAAAFRSMQRGWQARPGPYARWCLMRLSRTPQSSQAGHPAESTRGREPMITSGAPTHRDAQHTGASISAGRSLDKAGHHPDMCCSLTGICCSSGNCLWKSDQRRGGSSSSGLRTRVVGSAALELHAGGVVAR